MLFALAGVQFPFKRCLVFALNSDGHADIGKMLLQCDDVIVQQADAAFAGAAWHGVLVVGAAVDADALVAGCFQAQEPVAVGLDVAATVLEVMLPSRGILYHGDFEWFVLG